MSVTHDCTSSLSTSPSEILTSACSSFVWTPVRSGQSAVPAPSSSSTVDRVCVDALTFLRLRLVLDPNSLSAWLFHRVLMACPDGSWRSSAFFAFRSSNSVRDTSATTGDLDKVEGLLLLLVEFLLISCESFEEALHDRERTKGTISCRVIRRASSCWHTAVKARSSFVFIRRTLVLEITST